MKRYRSTRLSTDARIRASRALAAQREEQLDAEEIENMVKAHAPVQDQFIGAMDDDDIDGMFTEPDNDDYDAEEDEREELDDLEEPDASDLEELEDEMAEDAIETAEMEAESETDSDEDLNITEE
jgi:hypothetical protein